MSPEKFDPFKNQEKHTRPNQRKESQDNEPKMNRREFLKKGVLATGGLALSGTLFRLMKEMTGEEEVKAKKEDVLEPSRPTPDPEKEAAQKAGGTPEQEEIQKENVRSLTEVLDFDKPGKIELNKEVMEDIKNHWKEKYKKDPKFKNSLQEGYYEMGVWEPYLKEQFHQQGVPEKFIYLAIPESHWQLNAQSSAGAIGPYQFMPKTARMYGLRTDYYADNPRNLEERKDPVKSACACAALLRDLYESSGDWDMALAGYNGGYFWRYLKRASQNKEKVSYDSFLGYLEEKINTIKQELETNNYQNYKIQKGDTLERVAKKFGVDKKILCESNNIDNENRIYAGQKLNIPISKESQKKAFQERIKGMAENLNYPPKFNAVYELIQEGFVKDQKEPASFEVQKIQRENQKHIFRKEDRSIYAVAKKFPGISPQDILQANPEIDPNNLHGGEELIIPSPRSKPTLSSVADRYNIDLTKLKKTNPAIEDPRVPLPKGYQIRI